MLEQRTLTEKIIGRAIEVHRKVGPGLLESVYAEWHGIRTGACRHQLRNSGCCALIYKGMTIPLGFRADIVVENTIILEIKAVAALLLAHAAQLLTYLRMSRLRVGLLVNFHAPRRKDGLRRFIV